MDKNQKAVAIVEIKTRERYNLAKHVWSGIVLIVVVWLAKDTIDDIVELVTYLLVIIVCLLIAFFSAFKLMGDKTKNFAPYITKLEEKLDSNRTSSELTVTGDTQHRDK